MPFVPWFSIYSSVIFNLLIRHPVLDTGSSDLCIKVDPIRIRLFYQCLLPQPSPLLYLLLSLNGWFCSIMMFIINELMNAIFLRESLDPIFFMLVNTFNQTWGHAYVQHTVPFIRHDVNVKILLSSFSPGSRVKHGMTLRGHLTPQKPVQFTASGCLIC